MKPNVKNNAVCTFHNVFLDLCASPVPGELPCGCIPFSTSLVNQHLTDAQCYPHPRCAMCSWDFVGLLGSVFALVDHPLLAVGKYIRKCV